MAWDRIAASFCIMVGLSLLAGFITQFRQRGYLGWLGLCFLALAAAGFMSLREYPTGRNIALGIAGVLFVFAFISAALQTRQRLAEIRRHQEALEAQMIAMMEAQREKERREKRAANEKVDTREDI